MRQRDDIVNALRARGELWDVAPGVTALRGYAAALLRDLERAIATLCGLETSDDWRVPPAIDFATLVRAEYFASFPHWLTVASHLRDEEDALRAVAERGEPAVLREASAAPKAALNPAVCYHIYAALAGTSIDQARIVTAQAECWRHEGTRHATPGGRRLRRNIDHVGVALGRQVRQVAESRLQDLVASSPETRHALLRIGLLAARELGEGVALERCQGRPGERQIAELLPDLLRQLEGHFVGIFARPDAIGGRPRAQGQALDRLHRHHGSRPRFGDQPARVERKPLPALEGQSDSGRIERTARCQRE